MHLSPIEQAAINELEKKTAPLTRLEQLLVAAIVEMGRLEANTIDAWTSGHLPIPDFKNLSPRENEVLKLIVDGESNKEAAAALGISPRTIEVHRASILEKLKARSTADLVRIVMEAAVTRFVSPAK